MKNNKSEPIPVMDYRQYRRVRRLVHECCNYIDGNCIALDDGEECVCVQSISYSLLCRWFRAAVLPQDKELETALFHRLNAKKYRYQNRICRRSLLQVFGRCSYGCFIYDRQRSCTGSSRSAGIGRNQAALGAIYQPAARLCVSLQRPAERKNVIYQTRCQEPYSASGTFFVDFL